MDNFVYEISVSKTGDPENRSLISVFIAVTDTVGIVNSKNF